MNANVWWYLRNSIMARSMSVRAVRADRRRSLSVCRAQFGETFCDCWIPIPSGMLNGSVCVCVSVPVILGRYGKVFNTWPSVCISFCVLWLCKAVCTIHKILMHCRWGIAAQLAWTAFDLMVAEWHSWTIQNNKGNRHLTHPASTTACWLWILSYPGFHYRVLGIWNPITNNHRQTLLFPNHRCNRSTDTTRIADGDDSELIKIIASRVGGVFGCVFTTTNRCTGSQTLFHTNYDRQPDDGGIQRKTKKSWSLTIYSSVGMSTFCEFCMCVVQFITQGTGCRNSVLQRRSSFWFDSNTKSMITMRYHQRLST